MTSRRDLIEHMRAEHPNTRTNESYADLKKLHGAVHRSDRRAEREATDVVADAPDSATTDRIGADSGS